MKYTTFKWYVVGTREIFHSNKLVSMIFTTEHAPLVESDLVKIRKLLGRAEFDNAEDAEYYRDQYVITFVMSLGAEA